MRSVKFQSSWEVGAEGKQEEDKKKGLLAFVLLKKFGFITRENISSLISILLAKVRHQQAVMGEICARMGHPSGLCGLEPNG